MKNYNVMYNVGTVKYLVSYHDGIKKHDDGSPFFDIRCFSNKKKLNKFTRELIAQKYINL